jgi:hypothetical protein
MYSFYLILRTMETGNEPVNGWRRLKLTINNEGFYYGSDMMTQKGEAVYGSEQ